MKKILTAALSFLTCSAMALSLSSCIDLSGLDGKDGANGKSAYELAVENGFTGSMEEWLESLKSDITIDDVYESAVKNGYTGTFLEFLEEYLDVFYSPNTEESFDAKIMTSTVSVICEFTETVYGGSGFWGGGSSTEYVYSLGSGVIYDLDKSSGDAYIITNFHVVYDSECIEPNCISENIWVYLYGMEYSGSDEISGVPDYSIPATFIGGSLNNDLAVLKVTGSDILKSSNATKATVADSNYVGVGQTVYAVGNPSGEGLSVSKGVVSVDSQYIYLSPDDINTVTLREIRVDAAVNSGNSGGGLYDANGELIGIVNAKSAEDGVEGMGYAIPSTLAKNVVDNIIRNCDGVNNIAPLRATLGITVYNSASRSVYDEKTGSIKIVEEVAVETVSSGSAASGKIKAGDVLKSITIDGETLNVTRRFMLTDAMYKIKKGDTVTFVVNRGGSDLSIDITFDSDAYFTVIG